MKSIFLLALLATSGMTAIGNTANASICGANCPQTPVYAVSCDCFAVEANGSLRFLETLIEYSSAHSDPVTDANEHCFQAARNKNRQGEIRNCQRMN